MSSSPGISSQACGPVPATARPHPLSQVRHEFIWEGKYDEQGHRRTPDVPALSLRIVEEWEGQTVNGGAPRGSRHTANGGGAAWQSGQAAAPRRGNGGQGGGRQGAADGNQSPDQQIARSPNLLLRGDNRILIASLLPRFRAAIDLIYIDPPYDCGLDYRVEVPVGNGTASVHAYRDAWGEGPGSYAHMMAERLTLMRELLCPEGCIFVHCDWRASGVMRLLLDDIFGRACFRNEIVWRRAPNLGRQAASSQLGRVVDSIFVYSAREGTPFRGQTPMRAAPVELDGSGKPRGSKWDETAQCYFTTAPRGDYTDRSIERLRAENRVWESPSGRIYIKYFLRRGDDGHWYKDQPVDTLWDDADVRPLRHCSKDELGIGYATQKPEGLLRRIISWACPPGGTVADFFCGSGTTGVVAQQLGRRWIMADQGRQAIHTTRKRLIGSPAGECSFSLLDPAPSDRRYWFDHAFGSDAAAYRRFVLSGFAGASLDASADAIIHARHNDAAVHVAGVDHTVDAAFAEALARAARLEGASRVLCLAFEYTMDIRRDLDGIAATTGVRVLPVVIPLEIMESNRRKLPGWLEVARLEAEVVTLSPTHASVRLTRYETVPAKQECPPHRAQRHPGLDLIDAWSIDPGWQSDRPLRPVWHAQRGSLRRTLALESDPISLDRAAGPILVRVIDVFGHETRTLLTLPALR